MPDGLARRNATQAGDGHGRQTGAVTEIDRDESGAPAFGLALDSTHLAWAKSRSATYGPHQLQSLELVDLATGARRTLLQGDEGASLRPLALAWPNLLWKQWTASTTGFDVDWTDVNAPAPGNMLAIRTGDALGAGGATLIDGELYLVTGAPAFARIEGSDVLRYPSPGATPVPVQPGVPADAHMFDPTGVHGVIAWLSQEPDRLTVFDAAHGRVYRHSGFVAAVVRTCDALIWEAAAGTGDPTAWSLSRLEVGPP